MNSLSIKSGWQLVKFGDIAENVAIRVDPAKAEADIYVGLEHLDPETLHLRRWGHPSDVTGQKLAFKKGDVIFARRRAYQRKLAVAKFDGICSAHALVVRAKPNMTLPEFLPFFLQSDIFMERAIEISVGSLSPTINWKTLRVQEFPLPPLEVQKRIATILWAADEVYEKFYKAIEVSKNTLSTITNQIIQKGLFKIRLKKSKKFGTLPDHWKEFPLEKVCKQITDGEHVTPPREKSGIYLLSARNVMNGEVSLEDVDYISEETYNRLKKRVVPQEGDILISCSGTIGRVCTVPKSLRFSMVRSVAIFKLNSSMNSKFVEKVLQSKFLQHQIGISTSQLAQGNLFQGAIKKLIVPVPPVEEQIQIATYLSQLEKAMRELEVHHKITKQIRSLLINVTNKGNYHV